MMFYYIKVVCVGVKIFFIIIDMFFGSYKDEKIVLKNVIRVYKEI